MEINGTNIDDVRVELKKSNTEIIPLSNDAGVVNGEKEDLLKPFNEKIERITANFKMLEVKYASAVSDKFNIQRQLEHLKNKNDMQELKIVALQRQIDLFEEKKKKIADKWNLLNNHEMAMKGLKNKFEEQLFELLSDCSSGNGDRQSLNESDPIPFTENSLTNFQVGLSAGGIKVEGSMEERVVLPDLMKTDADRNHCHTMDTSVHGRSLLSRCYVSMRRTSGTTVKRLSRLSSITTTEVTRTKMVINRKLIARKRPVVVLHRNIKDKLNSKEVVPTRPRRLLTCTLCSKRYTSGPGNAFCVCVKGY